MYENSNQTDNGSSTVIIVATDRNGAIGENGCLPWRSQTDMRRFKAITMGKTIVMGRKTWESLPRKPLPQRDNVVLSKNNENFDGAIHASSLEDVFFRFSDIMVIGGGQIYNAFLPYTNRIELSIIDVETPGADTFFPMNLISEGWTEKTSEWRTPRGEPKILFKTLVRVSV